MGSNRPGDSCNRSTTILVHGRASSNIVTQRSSSNTLLIRHYHVSNFHAGLTSTLAKLREDYWLHQGRQQIRKLLRKCIVCQRMQSRRFDAPAAPLPPARITPAEPFAIVGVDFAGPLYVKSSSKSSKAYVVYCANSSLAVGHPIPSTLITA